MASLKGHLDMKHCQIKSILMIIDHYYRCIHNIFHTILLKINALEVHIFNSAMQNPRKLQFNGTELSTISGVLSWCCAV